jgi:leucine dehydrogenase
MNQIEVESHVDFDGHESVVFTQSDTLTAIIAVHNSNLGPAIGGCRMYPYASHDAALSDVLRLSKGMTYKSALAGLPLGGGKAVIIGDPGYDKTRELLLAMGEFVDGLGGRYITAEDSGTSVADISVIGERTRYVSGVNPDEKFGGDPSPLTAFGVYVGIREAVAYRCNSGLQDIRVAIQGVGNVGYHLTEMLISAGAKVTVADVNEVNVCRAKALGAEVVDVADILSAEVDVLAPCAMGGAINPQSVRNVRAGIVAGAANNQLASKEMGRVLLDRGVLYAPDYVINAGGIIDVYYQHTKQRSPEVVNRHIEGIGVSLRSIFEASDMRMISTAEVADEMAESIFREGVKAVA